MSAQALKSRKIITSTVEQDQARQMMAQVQEHPTWALLGTSSATESAPAELSRVLTSIVDTIARGGVVTVGTMPEHLTTTVAAEMLGVSRPTLMKMISTGELRAHKAGSHTRLKATDVVEFRRARLDRQRTAALELLAEFGDEE